MSKKSVAVRIAGHDYKILSDGDADSLREIARYVDLAMDRVRQRTGTVDTLDISVLTCLNLAREILALREQKQARADGGRLRSLIERVEIALGGPSSAERSRDDGSVADRDESGRAVGEARGDAKQGVSADANRSGRGEEGARTLDLPSVEALRERAGASSDSESESSTEEAMPEARIASGGRERAS